MKFSLFLIQFHSSFHCCSLVANSRQVLIVSYVLSLRRNLQVALERPWLQKGHGRALAYCQWDWGQHVALWHCWCPGLWVSALCSFGVLFSPARRALGKARLSHLPPASLGKSYRVPGTVSFQIMCWRALFPTESNWYMCVAGVGRLKGFLEVYRWPLRTSSRLARWPNIFLHCGS